MTENVDQIIERAALALRKAGAREVFVFGSAAEGRFNEESDLDLAVTGLPPRDFFPAMAAASAAAERMIDLIDLDEPTPFSDLLKKRGKFRRVG